MIKHEFILTRGVFRLCIVKVKDKPPLQYPHSPWQPLDWASAVDTPTSPQTEVYWSTLQTALDSSTGQSAIGESSDTATGKAPAVPCHRNMVVISTQKQERTILKIYGIL